MNSKECDRVRAAVHQFLIAAETADRTSREYRLRYEAVMERVAAVAASGRKRKAARWRKQLRAVRFVLPADGE